MKALDAFSQPSEPLREWTDLIDQPFVEQSATDRMLELNAYMSDVGPGAP